MKLLYTLNELAELLDLGTDEVADLLVGHGVRAVLHGKPFDLSYKPRVIAVTDRGDIGNEVHIVAESLPDTWKKSLEKTLRAQKVEVQQEDARTWWEKEYDIMAMAQNIGARFHQLGKATSNSEIAKEIERRMRDIEKRNGTDRKTPSWNRIRRVCLTGWRFDPGAVMP